MLCCACAFYNATLCHFFHWFSRDAQFLVFHSWREQKDKVARVFFENQNKRALSRGYSSKSGIGKRGGRGTGRGTGAHHRGRGGTKVKTVK